MAGAGGMTTQLLLQRRGLDENGDPLGDWETAAQVSAEITWLRGGEAVMQARLQGQQPVVLRVYKTDITRQVTAAWRAVDLLDPAQVFAIQARTPSAKDPNCFELMAKMGGSDA